MCVLFQCVSVMDTALVRRIPTSVKNVVTSPQVTEDLYFKILQRARSVAYYIIVKQYLVWRTIRTLSILNSGTQKVPGGAHSPQSFLMLGAPRLIYVGRAQFSM